MHKCLCIEHIVIDATILHRGGEIGLWAFLKFWSSSMLSLYPPGLRKHHNTIWYSLNIWWNKQDQQKMMVVRENDNFTSKLLPPAPYLLTWFQTLCEPSLNVHVIVKLCIIDRHFYRLAEPTILRSTYVRWVACDFTSSTLLKKNANVVQYVQCLQNLFFLCILCMWSCSMYLPLLYGCYCCALCVVHQNKKKKKQQQ